MSYRVPVPPDEVIETDNPTLLESVPTPDFVDFDEWMIFEDGGSARSPSTVHSPSTSSNFSSYIESVPGSPNDVHVGFSPAEKTEPDSPVVAQNPTGLHAGPGGTMHNIAAAQRGAVPETPGEPWNMTLSANELAARQAAYAFMYNQAQLTADQAHDFHHTMPSIPNPPATMMQSNGNPSSEA